MSNIYDQHASTFSCVSAFVIMRGKECVATVAFKFPRDGAARLYAYVHFIGAPMVRGYAGGYGYDKRTVAVEDAFKKIDTNVDEYASDTVRRQCARFIKAITDANDGQDWARSLTNAGYTVLQAV